MSAPVDASVGTQVGTARTGQNVNVTKYITYNNGVKRAYIGTGWINALAFSPITTNTTTKKNTAANTNNQASQAVKTPVAQTQQVKSQAPAAPVKTATVKVKSAAEVKTLVQATTLNVKTENKAAQPVKQLAVSLAVAPKKVEVKKNVVKAEPAKTTPVKTETTKTENKEVKTATPVVKTTDTVKKVETPAVKPVESVKKESTPVVKTAPVTVTKEAAKTTEAPVVLTAGVAGLICLVSTLVDAAFTGVVLAGSALITSFLTSFLAGATANEVANCFTGCATLFSVLTFKVLVWTGVLTSAALFAFTVAVAVLTGAAGA